MLRKVASFKGCPCSFEKTSIYSCSSSWTAVPLDDRTGAPSPGALHHQTGLTTNAPDWNKRRSAFRGNRGNALNRIDHNLAGFRARVAAEATQSGSPWRHCQHPQIPAKLGFSSLPSPSGGGPCKPVRTVKEDRQNDHIQLVGFCVAAKEAFGRRQVVLDSMVFSQAAAETMSRCRCDRICAPRRSAS